MNKFLTIQYLKKAGVTTCLFLYLTICSAQQKEWLGEESLYESYSLALNLRIKEAREQLKEAKTPEQIYVASLTDAIELLMTEDKRKFDQFENSFIQRLELLEEILHPAAESLFTMAELRLYWAFIYLKFGHEFDAAWNFRQAYLTVQECKIKYPAFLPIKKTSGLLEIILGSIPEKYHWLMSLLNMDGSVETGLNELEQVRSQSTSQYVETTLLYYLFHAYILPRTSIAMQGFDELLRTETNNRLVLFLGGSVAIKNSESEKALGYFQKVNENNNGIIVPYASHQLGEVYLHKGAYELSIESYQTFLATYEGRTYVKDAYYKIGICYWLMNNKTEAGKYFEKAKEEGKESAEADKYAARSLAENLYPNIKLLKIRYATDGGYYDEAKNIISSVGDEDLITSKEKIEFTYRKARLFHKSGSLNEARVNYLETIRKQGEENWYFAPNACLQLGYLLVDQRQPKEARKYFEKALSYKKHEYKNSIDSKAKSAFAQLKKK